MRPRRGRGYRDPVGGAVERLAEPVERGLAPSVSPWARLWAASRSAVRRRRRRPGARRPRARPARARAPRCSARVISSSSSPSLSRSSCGLLRDRRRGLACGSPVAARESDRGERGERGGPLLVGRIELGPDVVLDGARAWPGSRRGRRVARGAARPARGAPRRAGCAGRRRRRPCPRGPRRSRRCARPGARPPRGPGGSARSGVLRVRAAATAGTTSSGRDERRAPGGAARRGRNRLPAVARRRRQRVAPLAADEPALRVGASSRVADRIVSSSAVASGLDAVAGKRAGKRERGRERGRRGRPRRRRRAPSRRATGGATTSDQQREQRRGPGSPAATIGATSSGTEARRRSTSTSSTTATTARTIPRAAHDPPQPQPAAVAARAGPECEQGRVERPASAGARVRRDERPRARRRRRRRPRPGSAAARSRRHQVRPPGLAARRARRRSASGGSARRTGRTGADDDRAGRASDPTLLGQNRSRTLDDRRRAASSPTTRGHATLPPTAHARMPCGRPDGHSVAEPACWPRRWAGPATDDLDMSSTSPKPASGAAQHVDLGHERVEPQRAPPAGAPERRRRSVADGRWREAVASSTPRRSDEPGPGGQGEDVTKV